MVDYWFSADHHFGHEGIIKHCKRPFADEKEMKDVLIERWNAFVKPRDVVVYLGDFHWSDNAGNVLSFAKRRLAGTIIFVKGNHDRWIKRDKRYMYHKKIAGVQCWCAHYAFRTWPSGINLHGHCHGTLEEYVNQFDVGVDAWDYRPVNIEELKSRIDESLLTRKQRGELS